MDLIGQINQILTANGYSAQFIPSYVQPVTRQDEKYLFHHIKKCGGMSIHSAITICMRLSIEAKAFPRTLIARCDEDRDWRALLNDYGDFLNRFFISSHNAGNHYNCLGSEIKRVSVFREPFDRALSYYQYDCMRQARQPVLSEFEDYLFSEENTSDYYSPFLSSEEAQSAKAVIERLDSEFFSFFDISGIADFISGCISQYGLPNIVMDKQNATLSRYQLPEAQNLKTKYSDHHRPEQEIFDWVKSNPRIPAVTNNGSLNKYTMVLNSQQSEERYKGRAKLIETDKLFTLVARHKTESGLNAFFDIP
ncbi:hypothetical protein [Oceanospirillum sanctuarii]|uniref:hypothetical protein n=1 Tax=Oceanospirillum sanctuarii TaxID=1434821 RepID=UPI00111D8F3A|nr:hypothetical protein [Oceanospirillum sanctuarii]